MYGPWKWLWTKSSFVDHKVMDISTFRHCLRESSFPYHFCLLEFIGYLRGFSGWCRILVLKSRYSQQTEIINHSYYWTQLLRLMSRSILCDLWEHSNNFRHSFSGSYTVFTPRWLPVFAFIKKHIEQVLEK